MDNNDPINFIEESFQVAEDDSATAPDDQEQASYSPLLSEAASPIFDKSSTNIPNSSSLSTLSLHVDARSRLVDTSLPTNFDDSMEWGSQQDEPKRAASFNNEESLEWNEEVEEHSELEIGNEENDIFQSGKHQFLCFVPLSDQEQTSDLPLLPQDASSIIASPTTGYPDSISLATLFPYADEMPRLMDTSSVTDLDESAEYVFQGNEHVRFASQFGDEESLEGAEGVEDGFEDSGKNDESEIPESGTYWFRCFVFWVTRKSNMSFYTFPSCGTCSLARVCR